VDDIIVFPQLTEPEIVQIVDLMIAKLDVRMKDKDMGIELTPAAKALLAKRGYDRVLGARPLRRTIQRDIEDVLSEKILYGEIKAGQIVVVGTDGDEKDEKFTFKGETHSELDTPPGDIQDSDIQDSDVHDGIKDSGVQDTVTTPVAPEEK
jgi:ATP-dependent Clp protease ATP-binding subunit ClpC